MDQGTDDITAGSSHFKAIMSVMVDLCYIEMVALEVLEDNCYEIGDTLHNYFSSRSTLRSISFPKSM